MTVALIFDDGFVSGLVQARPRDRHGPGQRAAQKRYTSLSRREMRSFPDVLHGRGECATGFLAGDHMLTVPGQELRNHIGRALLTGPEPVLRRLFPLT